MLPPCGGAGRGGVNRLSQLTDVHNTGDTQRAPESASPLRQIETRPIEVEMGASTGPPADRIGHRPELARLALLRDDPQ